MKDPENYQFTAADYAYQNAMDLKKYEEEVPMTYYEKTLLRKWVMDGHNPRENPGSRYLCMTGSEPMDFLDVYRMDKEIKEEMKGMTKAQREAYLKELMDGLMKMNHKVIQTGYLLMMMPLLNYSSLQYYFTHERL